jgi:hypothetical protein
MLKSVGAVLAGFVFIAALGVLTDTALQSAGILPPTGQRKFEAWQSALALSYHALYAVLGCYLTARLAPRRPMAHALVLGSLGFVTSILGLIAIVAGDLAPAWYGWALIVLAIPLAWLGGRLRLARQRS